jgi:hypothetical protein
VRPDREPAEALEWRVGAATERRRNLQPSGWGGCQSKRKPSCLRTLFQLRRLNLLLFFQVFREKCPPQEVLSFALLQNYRKVISLFSAEKYLHQGINRPSKVRPLRDNKFRNRVRRRNNTDAIFGHCSTKFFQQILL